MRVFQREKVPKPQVPEGLCRFLESHQELHLEIGSGVGFFAIQLCQATPHIGLIAFEHTKNRFESFKRRLTHHAPLSNLFALHMNAISGVTHFIPSQTISKIYLNYPNPNSKNSSLRWFCMPFFSEILRTLKAGGEIQLLTNEAWYKNEALQAAKDFWKLSLVEDLSFVKNTVPGKIPRSHFEKKYLELGQTCHQLLFKKPA